VKGKGYLEDQGIDGDNIKMCFIEIERMFADFSNAAELTTNVRHVEQSEMSLFHSLV
jgi:hypothetical protein